ncbi:MAG: hypothetical protein EB078_09580, partial [Proteobacteria bacterium]|nr:hypothetical protein [Pseudomonadota bacterium]
ARDAKVLENGGYTLEVVHPVDQFLWAAHLEVVGIFALLKQAKPAALRGALIKNGSEYVLRWENSDKTVEAKSFVSPIVAINYAKHVLNLQPGSNPEYKDAVENVWVRKEMGKAVLLWKTAGLPWVNRLTFSEDSHIQVFEHGFKNGAYSTSPIGHSLSLIQAGIR